MFYADIQKRDFTSRIKQYKCFRKEKKDFDFFLDMIQPKHFLITSGLEDTQIQVKKLLEKRRKNFRVLFFEGGHSFPEDIRIKAYSFLEENLC